jgi:inner membrane protein
MPTIVSHAITSIPIALGFQKKVNKYRLLFLSILFSVLPDLDGIGFGLGIQYNSLFGHRGFSHSIVFVIIAAIIFVYLVDPKTKLKSRRFTMLFVNFFIIGILHILLDAMTNGGLGVALFSPFSNARFFFPWTPIEVSAILPQYFFQLNGLQVMKFELLYLVLPSIIISTLIIYFRRNHEKI